MVVERQLFPFLENRMYNFFEYYGKYKIKETKIAIKIFFEYYGK